MTLEWEAGRLDSDLDGVGFDTLAVRAGQRRSPEGEHGEALFLTSSYVFRTAADAAARFGGEVPGNVYSRYTNPTVRTFEERIAALEGAEQAVATASGMSAILAIVMSLCSGGDHVLVSRSVFGSTISLFEKYLKRFGIEVDYVPLADLERTLNLGVGMVAVVEPGVVDAVLRVAEGSDIPAWVLGEVHEVGKYEAQGRVVSGTKGVDGGAVDIHGTYRTA